MPTRHAILRRLARAFTLIELLVVMTILVILLLVAIPAFDYIRSARGTEAGVNVAAAMVGRARALALSRTDNKYIGVLFYNEPEGDRDAMQLVEVDAGDTSSGLERYFGWQASAANTPANTTPPNVKDADVVYSQAIDDKDVGGTGVSRYTNKPTVRRYVCLQTTIPNSAASKPPNSNGPTGFFTSAYWNTRQTGNMAPVSLDAEIQYLPRGVRARVLKPYGSAIVQPAGLILFDKQGRVTNRRWGISRDNDASIDGGEKLLEAMGITNTDLPISDDRRSGIALSVYGDKDLEDARLADAAKDPRRTKDVTDWVVKNAPQYTVGTQSGELIGGAAQ